MSMLIRNEIEAVASDGIESDIKTALGVAEIPESLIVAIKARIYQAYRDTFSMVTAQATSELSRILDRAFE